tara:strand:+ start:276 stop:395 length:120 start_codon:yes stop_codon:yes gene_type:complete
MNKKEIKAFVAKMKKAKEAIRKKKMARLQKRRKFKEQFK